MSMNAIQFQRGLSLPQFYAFYGPEQQCESALVAARWPHGWWPPPQLHWVNTLLGNLKTSMAGTYHSFDHAKYASRYWAEFCSRFNRRYDLPAMLPRLLQALATTRPLPLKELRV